eukprot:gene13846-16326_t
MSTTTAAVPRTNPNPPKIFKKPFGSSEKCVVCVKSVYATERLCADERVYHKTCFKCTVCAGVLKLGSFASMESKSYCKPCFKKLFFTKGNYSEGFGQLKPQHQFDAKKGNPTVTTVAPVQTPVNSSVQVTPVAVVNAGPVAAAKASFAQTPASPDKPSATTTPAPTTAAAPKKYVFGFQGMQYNKPATTTTPVKPVVVNKPSTPVKAAEPVIVAPVVVATPEPVAEVVVAPVVEEVVVEATPEPVAEVVAEVAVEATPEPVAEVVAEVVAEEVVEASEPAVEEVAEPVVEESTPEPESPELAQEDAAEVALVTPVEEIAVPTA